MKSLRDLADAVHEAMDKGVIFDQKALQELITIVQTHAEAHETDIPVTGNLYAPDNGRECWFTTASGVKVDVLYPRHDVILIEDVAHSLARQCRFHGHVSCDHYSVAQHSCLVSDHLPSRLRLAGLLHDAAEFALGDVTVVKMSGVMNGYKILERRWQDVIADRFGVALRDQHDPLIKRCDSDALATEKRDLTNGENVKDTDGQPWKEFIDPWSVERSYDEFMTRFCDLADTVQAPL